MPRFSFASLRRPVVLIPVFLLFALLTAILLRPLFGKAVDVLVAQHGDIRQSVVASGKVRSPQRSELAAQVSGQILAVHVIEGSQVAAGNLLIELDDREVKASVAQARTLLMQSELRLQQMRLLAEPLAREASRQAEANLTQARQQFARTEALVAKGFYSTNQLDDARRALTVAESQRQASQLQAGSNASGGGDYRLAEAAVEQARAGLELAQAKLAYTRILAPRPGTILARLAEPGDSVQPGKTLLSLSPAGATELLVQIDEKNLRLLALDQTARVSADAWPDRHFPARVSYISPAVDPQRGSVEVRLHVDNPPDYLKQDMTVSIDIETGSKQGVILLPAEGLRGSVLEQWVLVVREGRAVRQVVQTGLRNAGQVEIVAGLAAGDLVVPASNPRIAAGDRVRTGH
ncbi:efflux RND transporter periplasmic adaptor subunit [Azonexus sp.]|uniref:efflux RND transporter periplasmic adaptor subunit n=1 Tax=Azonexus sp. TaxID=1872668 RepID=UPI0027BA8277|nr:efflux RND transporter periplasmic adaptor subunit [Azonexus sp.]